MANALQISLVRSSESPLSNLSSDITRPHQVPTLQICTNSTLRHGAVFKGSQKLSWHSINHSLVLHKRRSHPLRYESIHSAGLVPVRAQVVEFKSRREVSIPFREGAFPATEYLTEPERVVKVTFPDSARITYLGNSVWRTRLKPITFFTLSATPVCDLKVYNRSNTLYIQSSRLVLDFSGLPEEYINQTIQFSLQGQLHADAKKGSQHKAGRHVDFNGEVSLALKVSLPIPLSLFPETLVMTVGDGILDTILAALETALVRGIIADYHSWCWAKQSLESNRALRVTGSM